MKLESLRYVSQVKLEKLLEDHVANSERYTSGVFDDLAVQNGWQIESKLVQINLPKLKELAGGAGSATEDIVNSLTVYEALIGMTPAIAMDERIWVRLSHIECFRYAKSRWLAGKNGDKLNKAVLKHMFAKGRTGIRDDNAISRLWWNMHIAKMIDPDDPQGVLKFMLLTSDYRMALVERSYTTARLPLARAIINSLRSGSWIADKKENFLLFMKELNRDAGGILFESVPASESAKMVEACISKAQSRQIHLHKSGLEV